ncbi:MAG: amidase [Hyphomicrobiales bacterium]|nr:MAG: amidase [Hyphomicrobiales bacterium]
MSAADCSIDVAGARLRDGSLSALALAEAYLARIKARDPLYNAFITVAADRALEDAARADRELSEGVDRGPLHGIPIGLKDLIDTAGIRTTAGSLLFETHIPAKDAAVAARLQEAGAVLIGKLMTYEFALVGPSFDLPFPASRNPWNTDHITGGSSSGSAAAVAGGLLRTSIGTDTGGSIRSPASYCGVVGLKPTYDRVSRAGIFPLSSTLDHVGPISATVAEAALTLDAIAAGTGAASRIGESIEGRRIAYARDWFAGDPETNPAVIAAMDDAASALSLLGARIEEVKLPDYALYEAAGAVIIQAEALALHTELLRTRQDEYGVVARRNLLTGLTLSAQDVALARQAAEELARRLQAEVFGRFDALVTANTLTPALPFSAFDGETAIWTHMRTLPFNLTRNPVLALPIGFASGLPLGMQVVGRLGDEAGVCAIGHAFERATDHSVQRPPLTSEFSLQPA